MSYHITVFLLRPGSKHCEWSIHLVSLSVSPKKVLRLTTVVNLKLFNSKQNDMKSFKTTSHRKTTKEILLCKRKRS